MTTGGQRSRAVSQKQFEATYGVSKAELRAWLRKVNNTPQTRSLTGKGEQR
jgi:DNA-binding transcriptional regulator YiaG